MSSATRLQVLAADEPQGRTHRQEYPTLLKREHILNGGGVIEQVRAANAEPFGPSGAKGVKPSESVGRHIGRAG